MIRFLSHLRSVINFMRLPADCRRLTFYSEGQNYWPHLEGLILEVLAISDLHVSYISSSEDDPGLMLDSPNFSSYLIDDGFVRNWLFENIETDVMVMTMPDINQYQVKRSKHNVHYVYVQHSLVSKHMVYRTGAFDYYDTIFCAGPHHLDEMRALEKSRSLKSKRLFEHGYARLDSIRKEAKKRRTAKTKDDTPIHVLIAPSWGNNGTIESGLGLKITTYLLDQGFRVTLRPHPQTIIFFRDKVDSIIDMHKNNDLFEYELNVAGQDSLHNSDIMVGDWSGAALDYALGLGKPVIFIDIPRKVNNVDYAEIDIEPLEVKIRAKLGIVVDPQEMNIDVERALKVEFDEFDDYVFNLDCSSQVGARELVRICEEYKTQ